MLWRRGCVVCVAAVLLLLVRGADGLLCPFGGWLAYGDSCYHFSNANHTRSWSDSLIRCQQQDADLVTIDSVQERVRLVD
jgi:hypothetical protein